MEEQHQTLHVICRLCSTPRLVEYREGVHLRHEQASEVKGRGKPKDLSKKAVLLSGPPGIGKTSSASIISRYPHLILGIQCTSYLGSISWRHAAKKDPSSKIALMHNRVETPCRHHSKVSNSALLVCLCVFTSTLLCNLACLVATPLMQLICLKQHSRLANS